MPPRALRRAAAAAPLRLRAPPRRSAGLKPGPAQRSGAPPRPAPIGCPRSHLPPPGPSPRPTLPPAAEPGGPEFAIGPRSRGPARRRLRARSVPHCARAQFPPRSRRGGQRRRRGLRAPGGAPAPRSGSARCSSLRSAAAGGPGFPRVSAAGSGKQRGSSAGFRRCCSPRPPRLCSFQRAQSSLCASRCPVFPLLPLDPESQLHSTFVTLRARRARAEPTRPRLHSSRRHPFCVSPRPSMRSQSWMPAPFFPIPQHLGGTCACRRCTLVSGARAATARPRGLETTNDSLLPGCSLPPDCQPIPLHTGR
ncbi:uncharacterized protein DKFZp434B061-like [Choloepus didactylus]|uniref:uncharacterized protein DKFZp434B061-like n=1 Tax=Choloepus didactylus TaxID=27675 RepID=UPI00189F6442|nr:uncharacterized protein DKFZp434B061-like [Choloepus didactylus]